MKRGISIFAIIAMLSVVFVIPISVGATGVITPTADGVYEIRTADELKWVSEQINADTEKTGMSKASYKLMNDISLEGEEWTPIGKLSVPFNGTFDGNGYRVANLKVTTPFGEKDSEILCITDNGFFGMTGDNAVVENLGIDSITVAVYVHNSNNTTEGNKYGRANTLGGMVGHAGGTWKNCYVVNSSVKNTRTDCNESHGTGGFAGYVEQGAKIENCYVRNIAIRSGQVRMMGGFFADSSKNIEYIKNCYVADVYIDRVDVSHSASTNDGPFYAFGASLCDRSKIVNCFSTEADSYAGHRTDPSSITDETVDKNKCGTPETTQDEILSVLMENGEFVEDEHGINEGFPTLAVQKINPIAYAYTAITFDEIKGDNLTEDEIIRNLNLPDTMYGCTIAWESDNEIIDVTTGQITRPSESVNVTLTATISKSGYDTQTKSFNLTLQASIYVDYKTLVSNKNQTYHFFAIDDTDTLRGYLGVYTWLNDDSGFICGKRDGRFYLYNVINSELVYLDKAMAGDVALGAYVAGNDRVYYKKTINGVETLCSIDPKNPDDRRYEYAATEKESIGIEVSNDGKYTYYTKGSEVVDDDTHQKECGRINLETDEIDRRFTYQYIYPYTDEPTYEVKNGDEVIVKYNMRVMNHHIINPGNPDIFMFAIDDGRPLQLNAIKDRVNVVNFNDVNGKTVDINSPEVDHYEDGDYDSETPGIRPSHAVWSRDGKYVYLSELGSGTPKGQRFVKVGVSDAGKFIYPSDEWGFVGNNPGANHGNADAASKWALVDNNGIALLNMQAVTSGITIGANDALTIITNMPKVDTIGHPYHGHAEMSASGKIGTWGMEVDGVLGIAWIDVDSYDIASMTKVNNTVTSVVVSSPVAYTLTSPESVTLYVVAYDKDGRLKDMRKAEYDTETNGTQTLTFDAIEIPDKGYVKAMLWDGCRPLAVQHEKY